MVNWLRELDRVLRGDATWPDALTAGELPVSGRRLFALNIILGMVYGACMGVFALFNRDVPEWQQPIAAMIKIPALFFLTLLVTFPSLYVFNALVGSRLTMLTLARLMMATLGVTLALLASLGPIVAFFSVTTTSYPFILLLNVVVSAVAGLFGMNFLFRTMLRLTEMEQQANTVVEPAPIGEASGDASEWVPLRPSLSQRTDGRARGVFMCWMIVFGLVGAQMSWILRPFLGHPNAKFEWFRPRTSNFFEAVLNTWRSLFS